MGFRCAWIGCRGWDLETLLEHAGRSLAGEQESMLNVGVYAVDGSGWVLLVGSGTDHFTEIDWEDAVAWSKETDVLYFATNDTVMVSGLSALRGGEQLWSVSCNALEGAAPPDASGELPAEAREVLAAADSDEGYEVPADVGEALTGYRHDAEASGFLLNG